MLERVRSTPTRTIRVRLDTHDDAGVTAMEFTASRVASDG
ncbi:hypothetical protein QE438_003245 [Pseudoxanthomonas sp. SORGH_AS 997]|uniref:Uncharacterized protein n=1 Tax=Pseudoxanthomonas winnipegensis TaxID=2480810 RepID=A0AAW8GEH3_9GAMM|nr:hypothetical protein [Pseudoxanthomonas winnipegensis]MDQ1133821.1 hypothetical protein [Pseudoxanthomonas winnipegensis]MDR6139941.1 hypothetical protein [Pseudoxanthomonas sp. SORGH_AS_0997]